MNEQEQALTPDDLKKIEQVQEVIASGTHETMSLELTAQGINELLMYAAEDDKEAITDVLKTLGSLIGYEYGSHPVRKAVELADSTLIKIVALNPDETQKAMITKLQARVQEEKNRLGMS